MYKQPPEETSNEIQYVMFNKSMLIRDIRILRFHDYSKVH